MPSKNDPVVKVLLVSERELLVLLSEAAKQGDYDAIERTRAAAHGVRVLLDRLTPSDPTPSVGVHSPDDRPQARGTQVLIVREPRPVSGSYPRFVIQGDVLTKTGWSKRDRREYDHKARRPDFERVVMAMIALCSAGRGPFTAHAIVSRLLEDGEDRLPDYKVYVTLAFLKYAGLVLQDGREGYQFDKSLAVKARTSWEALADGGISERANESIARKRT